MREPMQMPKAEHINPVITVRKRVASSTHLPLTTMTESRAAFHPARFHAATGIPSLATTSMGHQNSCGGILIAGLPKCGLHAHTP